MATEETTIKFQPVKDRWETTTHGSEKVREANKAIALIRKARRDVCNIRLLEADDTTLSEISLEQGVAHLIKELEEAWAEAEGNGREVAKLEHMLQAMTLERDQERQRLYTSQDETRKAEDKLKRARDKAAKLFETIDGYRTVVRDLTRSIV